MTEKVFKTITALVIFVFLVLILGLGFLVKFTCPVYLTRYSMKTPIEEQTLTFEKRLIEINKQLEANINEKLDKLSDRLVFIEKRLPVLVYENESEPVFQFLTEGEEVTKTVSDGCGNMSIDYYIVKNGKLQKIIPL